MRKITILVAVIMIFGSFFTVAYAKDKIQTDVAPANPKGYQSSVADLFFVDESQLMRVTANGTYQVNINCPCDEEFRALSDWKKKAFNAVENADDYLFSEYGINLNISAYRNWDSNDSATDLFAEAKSEWGKGSYNMMIAFTDQGSGAGEGNTGYPYAIIWDNGSTNNKKVCQHEVGHCYGCSHNKTIYPNGHDVSCIMNNTSNMYNYFDTFCTDHDTIMVNNKGKYGS